MIDDPNWPTNTKNMKARNVDPIWALGAGSKSQKCLAEAKLRARILNEAAKIVEKRGKAIASVDMYYTRLAVHALLDKLAADIRTAANGKEE